MLLCNQQFVKSILKSAKISLLLLKCINTQPKNMLYLREEHKTVYLIVYTYERRSVRTPCSIDRIIPYKKSHFLLENNFRRSYDTRAYRITEPKLI